MSHEAARHPTRGGPALRRSSGWAAAEVLIAALAIGCGSDSDDAVAGPLPTGADDPRAYTEHFLAHNPRPQLRPEHLAIVRLEPIGGDDGDTCAGRDGVDCLPYAFDQETQVTLSIDDGAEAVDRAALLDASGATVLTAAAGGEPVTAVVPAGSYALDLFHVFAGDPDAAEADGVHPAQRTERRRRRAPRCGRHRHHAGGAAARAAFVVSASGEGGN